MLPPPRPQSNKSLTSNGDGTYTLSLSVTGKAQTGTTVQAAKSNVIIVMDRSNSMNNNRGQNGSQNAGKKCRFCGTMNESVAAFCEYCGRPLNESRADRNAQPFGGDQGYGGRDSYQTDSYQTYQSYQGGASSALLDKFVSKMKISSTIWLILGIYQCVIGLPLIMFFGYGLTTIGLGVWNIIQRKKKKKMAEQYYQNPTGIVDPCYRISASECILWWISGRCRSYLRFDDYQLCHQQQAGL